MRHHKIGWLIGWIAIILLLFAGCSRFRFITAVELVGGNTFEAEVGTFDCSEHELTVLFSDGETETVTLSEDMIATADRMKFYKPGTHVIRYVYGDAENTFTLTVKRHEFENVSLTFDDLTVDYDGMPHTLRIGGELPEGTTVAYPNGNSFTDVGEYPVKAIVTKDGYRTEEVWATLTINPVDFDLGDAAIHDLSVTYDGEERMIYAENVPDGVDVTYSIYSSDRSVKYSRVVNAGEYVVVAHFTPKSRNYKPITEDPEAVLTILRAPVSAGGAEMKDLTVDYDGSAYGITLRDAEELLRQAEVEYRYFAADGMTELPGKPSDAGTYVIRAEFRCDQNHEAPDPIEAVLTINPISIDTSMLKLYSATYVYEEGVRRSLNVTGVCPEGVKVVYSDNNGQEAAGSYEVTATILPEDPVNYTVTDSVLTASLIIDKANVTVPFSSSALVRDDDGTVRVTGLGEGLTATLQLFDADDAPVTTTAYWKYYGYQVTFAYTDPEKNNSCVISDARGVISFGDASVFPGDNTVLFNGSDAAEGLYGTCPVPDPDWKGSYEWAIFSTDGETETILNKAIMPGDYRIAMACRWNAGSDSFLVTSEATLSVRNEFSAGDRFADPMLVWNGEAQTPAYSLPVDISAASIRYFDEEGTEVDAGDVAGPGTYRVEITLEQNPLYLPYETEYSTTLTIKKEFDPAAVIKNLTFTYDGFDRAPVYPIPDDVPILASTLYKDDVRCTDDRASEPGLYVATVELGQSPDYYPYQTDFTVTLEIRKILIGWETVKTYFRMEYKRPSAFAIRCDEEGFSYHYVGPVELYSTLELRVIDWESEFSRGIGTFRITWLSAQPSTAHYVLDSTGMDYVFEQVFTP